ncbi:MAG TPA: transposase, partial [Xanthobacteraceae bacterium]|nr:transposase [Xanthobacteraceae bacterium]
GVFRRRTRIVEVSEAFRRLRACSPGKRLVVIMDNLHNVHDHPRFLARLRRLHIHPVWTPTDASWLNAIDAHFGVTRRATLTGRPRPCAPAAPHLPLPSLPESTRRQKDHPLTRIRSVRLIKLERH